MTPDIVQGNQIPEQEPTPEQAPVVESNPKSGIDYKASYEHLLDMYNEQIDNNQKLSDQLKDAQSKNAQQAELLDKQGTMIHHLTGLFKEVF